MPRTPNPDQPNWCATDRLFTFGLRYEHFTEELDIMAPNLAAARKLAEAQAAEEYDPGYNLIELPPGGSGGLVWTLK